MPEESRAEVGAQGATAERAAKGGTAELEAMAPELDQLAQLEPD